MESRDRRVTRRAFLQLNACATASMAIWLAACARPNVPASTNPVATAASGTTALQLPTYMPFAGVKPDLPAGDKGIDPAFFSFPTTLTRSVTETPGNGGDVTAA